MIKNIIFDLGNVLIDFKPVKYLQSMGLNKNEVDFIHREIYLSEEWKELDRGTLNRNEALQRIYRRNGKNRALLETHSDFMKVLTPIEKNTALLTGLKKRGFHLFYLTNYHEDLFQICFKEYNFFREFEGGVVSAHIKHVKPEPEMYLSLLGKFKLKPEECLFIDDLKDNTIAAEKLGIKTLHLENSLELPNKLEQFLS